jgi:hypothetical protein
MAIDWLVYNKKNSRKKGSKGKKTTTNSKKCEDKK